MFPTHICCHEFNPAKVEITGVVPRSRRIVGQCLVGKKIVWNGYVLKVTRDVTSGKKRTLFCEFIRADAPGTSSKIQVL